MQGIGKADPVVSGKRSRPEAEGQIAAGRAGRLLPVRHHTFSAREKTLDGAGGIFGRDDKSRVQNALMPKWPGVGTTIHFVKYLLSKNHR